MFDQILSKIQTTEDQEEVVNEIEILLKSLYQDKGLGFESVLSTSVRAWLASLLRQEFSKEDIDKEAFLINLKNIITDIPKVHLTLAFEPSQDALNRIVGVIRSSIGGNVIVSLRRDPYLIGGVEIIFEGEYRDFTFKRIFEKEFEKSRSDLLRSLDRNS
jgi:hypothetical protein